MTKKSLFILLMVLNGWLPWTKEAKAILLESKAQVIFTGQVAHARGMCCGQNPPSFAITAGAMPDAWPMITLHETQHLLGTLYAKDGKFPRYWTYFTAAALACTQDNAPNEMPAALKFARLGPYELHAQLPWLLKDKLCSKLQPWYPWFGLD